MTAWSVLRGRAFDYSQIRSDDGDFANADMLVLGNAALQHLSTKHDWPWLYAEGTISAVVGTRDYSIATLDADWTKTAWLGIDKYKPMTAISLREAHEWSNTERTGRPLYFAHVGNASIRIAPYPNQAYTINVGYYQAETPLTGDASEPAWYSDYEDYLTWEVVRRMGIRKGDDNIVRRAEKMLDEWRRDLADNVQGSKKAPRIQTRKDLGF